MADIQFAPILPFNDSIQNNFLTYDEVVYSRDINLIDENCIRMHSPEMIKYYSCKEVEPIKIGGD